MDVIARNAVDKRQKLPCQRKHSFPVCRYHRCAVRNFYPDLRSVFPFDLRCLSLLLRNDGFSFGIEKRRDAGAVTGLPGKVMDSGLLIHDDLARAFFIPRTSVFKDHFEPGFFLSHFLFLPYDRFIDTSIISHPLPDFIPPDDADAGGFVPQIICFIWLSFLSAASHKTTDAVSQITLWTFAAMLPGNGSNKAFQSYTAPIASIKV